MNLRIHPTDTEATRACADLVGTWLTAPETRSIMVAAGNTPLPLYREIARRQWPLAHLQVFMLDEYVGVPASEPRNCANLLRGAVVDAWGIPPSQYHVVSSEPARALDSVIRHERAIEAAGGIDVLVLGLGQNGHLGFNEPGSTADSGARLVPLQAVSVEANRQWFGGAHAPDTGATVGLRTLLAARRIVVLAFGAHKAAPVAAMMEGPATPDCPASLLQTHPATWLFVDATAAARLQRRMGDPTA